MTAFVDRPMLATFVGLKRAGVDINVVCRNDPDILSVLEAESIPYVDIPIFKNVDPEAIASLRHELIAGDYDILHVFTNKTLQNGLRAAKDLPIRIVAYRGIVGNVSFFSPISWMRFLNPRIDKIVCVADAVRDYFLAMRPAFLRVPASRLLRIYKGHSLDWYTAAPADLRQLGIPEDAFVITVAANYRPRKGIEVLVDALSDLPLSWPVHLLLIGAMAAPKLDRAIAASPIAERIHRVGYREDAPALIAASDLFVLPSIKREGLARSLIEAMAYSRPVIATDCGGSPELVEDGVSGIVVPPGDATALSLAIRRLYEDEDLRRELGRAARERIANEFRIERTIEQTLELYRELAAA